MLLLCQLLVAPRELPHVGLAGLALLRSQVLGALTLILVVLPYPNGHWGRPEQARGEESITAAGAFGALQLVH